MFLGFGEEISWGQRLFGFGTPKLINKYNVQGEFNLHNLDIFNIRNFDGNLKTGVERILSINFLYRLFWLGYALLLPAIYQFSIFIRYVVDKIRLPLPPINLGIFFLINWIVYRTIFQFFLPEGKTQHYYDTILEQMECISAFLFFMLSIYFYNLYKTKILDA